jgi:hypothetical protein
VRSTTYLTRSRSTRVRGLPLFAFAVAGLLAGHGLSYIVAVPDPYHRDLLLDRTGHAYLPAAGRLSLILVIAAVATVVARALSSHRSDPLESLSRLTLRLGALQVAAFVGLEVLERLLSGSPLDAFVGDRLLLVGIAAQLLVAAAGATLMRWLIRASTRLAEAHRSGRILPRATTVALGPTSTNVAFAADVRLGTAPRAPPAA